MFLTYNKELRSESDEQIIENLQRKGWEETVPPSYDPERQHAPEWIDGKWVIRDLTPAEIAALKRKAWDTSAAFWAEFLPAEQLGILDSQLPEIKLLDRALVIWPGQVWSDDDRVQKGLSDLVNSGIITEARKAEILKK